jgi:hypothetical protein
MGGSIFSQAPLTLSGSTLSVNPACNGSGGLGYGGDRGIADAAISAAGAQTISDLAAATLLHFDQGCRSFELFFQKFARLCH